VFFIGNQKILFLNFGRKRGNFVFKFWEEKRK